MYRLPSLPKCKHKRITIKGTNSNLIKGRYKISSCVTDYIYTRCTLNASMIFFFHIFAFGFFKKSPTCTYWSLFDLYIYYLWTRKWENVHQCTYNVHFIIFYKYYIFIDFHVIILTKKCITLPKEKKLLATIFQKDVNNWNTPCTSTLAQFR